MPTIAQLQYLLALHQSGHFGQAAALAGVSQPTLSTQIQKVEAELGIVIFDRQQKPVVATERGRLVIERARRVVEAHEDLLRVAAGQSRELSGNFSLGVIPTLAPYVLPWFLARFAEAHPKVSLSIYEHTTDELITEITHNRIDAAILATPLGVASFEEKVLFYDPFYLYANGSEKVLEEAEVDVDTLEPRKMWLLEDGHCVRTQVVSFCDLGDRIDERVQLGSVRFAAGSFETIVNLIDASEGYTLIPETYARTLAKSVRQRSVRPFTTGHVVREVSLVHHKRSWKSDVIEHLFDAIKATTPRSLKMVGADGEILPVMPAS